LQIEKHLALAFEEGFRIGENLAEQFNAKPAEIRRFLRSELTNEMLAAGLPI
jgi:hypothetical protein